MGDSSYKRSPQGHSVQISKNSRYGGGFGSSQQRNTPSRSFSPQPGARVKGNTAKGPGVQRGGMAPGSMRQGRGQMPSLGQSRMGYAQGAQKGGRGGYGGGQYGNQYAPMGNDYMQEQPGRSRKSVAPKKGMYKEPRIPFVGKLLIFFVIVALIVGVIAYTFVNSDSYRIKQVTKRWANLPTFLRIQRCSILTRQLLLRI